MWKAAQYASMNGMKAVRNGSMSRKKIQASMAPISQNPERYSARNSARLMPLPKRKPETKTTCITMMFSTSGLRVTVGIC